MKNKRMGEQASIKEEVNFTLDDAIKMVKEEIDTVGKCLKHIAKTKDATPISVDGRTIRGQDASVWANPSEIAKIMLKYNHHCWRILGLDSPDAMWEEIADLVGLGEVFFVDIPLCSAAEEIINTKTD